MGLIGRWIDEKCRTEPDVMRRVLGRRFGNLQGFLEDDRCGCLIGSYGLERRALWTYSIFFSERFPKLADRLFQCLVPAQELAVGTKVWGMTRHGIFPRYMGRKRPDHFVIRLLKQRIRKSLGLAPVRENRPDASSRETPLVGVGASRPTGDPA